MVLRRFVRALVCAPLLVALVAPAAEAAPTGMSPAIRSDMMRNAARPAIRLPRSTATPNLDASVSRLATRQALGAVVNKVQSLRDAGKTPVVVFDIDDTLTKWKKNDTVPGALDYVKTLKESGAKVVYITGRREGKRAETIEHLKEHGFPIGKDERLVLNDTGLKVPAYKAVAARNIVKEFGTPVAAFDNEKDNARVFRRALPNSFVFRLRTTSQKGDKGGLGHISVINDYTPFTSGK